MVPCSCTTQSWLKQWLNDPDLYKCMTPLHEQVTTCVPKVFEVSVLLTVRYLLVRHVP